MKNFTAQKIAFVACFSALAALLSLFDFNLPLFPLFIKLDFADLPALIATFIFGPALGILIQIIRNFIHLFISNTGGIGELANMLIGVSLIGTVGFLYHHVLKGKQPFLALLAGILVMTSVAMLANYYLLLPLFSLFIPLDEIFAFSAQLIPFVHDKFTFVVYVIMPFNLIKGSIVAVFGYALYKKLSPAFAHLTL
ncbi:MAG TPA: ECF transporter S component [Candidatus Avacidaminococcus intestinavium]|uniref:Riboflavin transporter n=1 Tax=Candidatus Avacidaminococcus intestinavium TaxID=2840684 RepID=A0A9D1SLF9_9FIRM|nr:ECF transporter S component [Candidatus Avacidaminococcus intestinavium]